MSEWLLFNFKRENVQLYQCENKSQWMRWHPLCTRTTCFVVSLWCWLTLVHIITNVSQPVFGFTPLNCILSWEAANVNLIVFCLTWTGFKPPIYHTRCTTNTVQKGNKRSSNGTYTTLYSIVHYGQYKDSHENNTYRHSYMCHICDSHHHQ